MQAHFYKIFLAFLYSLLDNIYGDNYDEFYFKNNWNINYAL